jgi:hypothetical protein
MRLCSAIVTIFSPYNELFFSRGFVHPRDGQPHTVVTPLNTIVGQPTTKSMDRMTEQMAQMVAPIKTKAWGGFHGSLALVLEDVD